MEEEKKESKESENEDLLDDDLEEFDGDSEEKNSDHEESDEKSKTKKTQSRSENKKYAEIRRKNAELEKQLKEMEESHKKDTFDNRVKAISSSTLEELGLESIEDEDDLFRCEEFEKAVKRGSDNPLLDSTKAYRNLIRNEKKKNEEMLKERESNQKKLEDDKVLFKKTFGFDTSVAIADNRFMQLYGDQIEHGNLTKLYTKYKSVFGDEKNDEAKNMGKIPTSSTRQSEKKKSILDLDDEDFLKEFDKRYK